MTEKQLDILLHWAGALGILIVGYIVMIYIHGLLDYTIFFVSTGFLFAMIVSSFDIYRKEIDQ